MTGAALVAVTWWQGLLDGLGSVLAFIYNVVPNYGLAIILFTLGIRLLLLPLGIKQVRSMQSMQAIQPQMKALQQKYKGNRQKLNEEVMKLYRENRVNPFMGCLPLLAQVPVLIALFAVLQFPLGLTHIPHSEAARAVAAPPDSRLYVDLVCSGPNASDLCPEKTTEKKTNFLGANLLCNALQAGNPNVRVQAQKVVDAPTGLDCGSGWPSRIPYYIFAIGMIASTYYQQRQMQRASVGPQQQQQQLMTRIMPVFLGFISLSISAGVLVYWVTTNAWQIGQQHLMLRSRVSAAEAAGKPRSSAPKATPTKEARKGGRSQPTQGDGSKVTGSGGGRDARGRKKRRKR